MTPETALKNMAAAYWGCRLEDIFCTLFGKGASGRFLCRLSNGRESVVGIWWNMAREDNGAFVSAARRLYADGVPVPRIHVYEERGDAEGDAGGMALVEDMGDVDLLSLKGASWTEKKGYYLKALSALDKLHRASVHDRMQPPFDEALYRWEREYFGEHFLGTYLGCPDWRELAVLPDLEQMAAELSALPRCLVHRDFQSQNIMVEGGEAYLIDFQGMRMGLPEYDVASLLYDPYADLSGEEREELWQEWVLMSPDHSDRSVYYRCACQRLMQALGAFANIACNKGLEWYLAQIPPAIRSLLELLSITNLAKPLQFRLVEKTHLLK